MRFATVSILAIFATIPAFADARLPVVNVAAGAVSARAAFGEELVQYAPLKIESQSVAQTKSVEKKVSVNSGTKQLSNVGDVLSPRKPSGDLWARSGTSLRMPQPQEFASLDNDAIILPEEDLEPAVIARPSIADNGVNRGDMDLQIAKLVDSQRRADTTLRAARTITPGNINSYDFKQPIISSEPDLDIVKADIEDTNKDIKIDRVVIPSEDRDVVVRKVAQESETRIAVANDDFAKMSPGELKKAFKKTYLSENKHLSTYKIDDRFDVASDLSTSTEGFTAEKDLSESGGVRPLEIKIGFRGEDSSLSRDNYNLLSEYASVVVSNPKRAIQVSIPENATRSLDGRKMAARRLAIVEQVLKDTGVSDQRIVPVLSQRSDESFVLRVISSDQYETLTQQKRDMFGDNVGKKTYKSMTW